MSRTLNIPVLERALATGGLSQADLARKLDVSREAVSKWLKGGSFPSPDRLLRIGLLLGLSYQQLVTDLTHDEPVVAFRKKGGRRTTEEHIARAKRMGRLLRRVAPYLPLENQTTPPELRQPHTDYEYIERAAAGVRTRIGGRASDPLKLEELLREFMGFAVVIVPVFWGDREAHENALHVHLPDSKTTWIYLNLDSSKPDFLFWVAHELGHVLTPGLTGKDEGEDFADSFAGALLVPHEAAWAIYATIAKKAPGPIVSHLKREATRFGVSPITVYTQVEKLARARGLPPIRLPKGAIYPASTNFKKASVTVCQEMFGDRQPTAREYVEKSKRVFGAPFFDALSRLLRETETGIGFVQSVLNVPAIDARAIAKALC